MAFEEMKKFGDYAGKRMGTLKSFGGLFRKSPKKAGSSPGTIVFVGDRKTENVSVSVIHYNESSIDEAQAENIENCFARKDPGSVTWINVTGLHDIEQLRRIGIHFGLHPLVLEDIANTNQRPKMESFESYIFIVAKMLYIDEETGGVATEQVSMILGEHYVLTFQEVEKDVFGPLRERIRKGSGTIRRRGPDYLLYALLDSIVDHYFIVLEHIGELVERIEDELEGDPDQSVLISIRNLKKEAILIRRAVWPLREILSAVVREEVKLVTEGTAPFLRDVYDHTIQTIDTVETFRDMLSGMNDLYLSNVSNKMNEVMKVLTIIATIFIPLTFMAGIYGMNFKHMPELGMKYSYPVFWCVLILVGAVMLAFFRKKKWL